MSCQTCSEDCIGEAGRRIEERIIDENNRNKISYLLRHARDMKRKHICNKDFKIIRNNYCSALKKMISKTLFIKNFSEVHSQVRDNFWQLKAL